MGDGEGYSSPSTGTELLHFDGSALLFAFGFPCCGLILRHAGLHDARLSITELLCFLASKAGQLANDLDDLSLLGPSSLARARDLGLLFCGYFVDNANESTV